MTGSFDTRPPDVISDPDLSGQSEGVNEAFSQSEEGFCLGMAAFKICNLRLDPLWRRPYYSLAVLQAGVSPDIILSKVSMGTTALNDMKSPLRLG